MAALCDMEVSQVEYSSKRIRVLEEARDAIGKPVISRLQRNKDGPDPKLCTIQCGGYAGKNAVFLHLDIGQGTLDFHGSFNLNADIVGNYSYTRPHLRKAAKAELCVTVLSKDGAQKGHVTLVFMDPFADYVTYYAPPARKTSPATLWESDCLGRWTLMYKMDDGTNGEIDVQGLQVIHSDFNPL